MSPLFGTDGIRGQWLEPPFTPELACRLGGALRARFSGPILVVRDTRESGSGIQQALAEGLGDVALDCGVLPTPALSALLAQGAGAAGVAITASHNPWTDNGLKVLGPGGTKLSPEIEAQIEKDLSRDWPIFTPSGNSLPNAEERYIDALLRCLPPGRWLSGVTIAMDCAHGAAWRTAPLALARLGADRVVIGASPDGRNINRGVGALHPEALQQTVRSSGVCAGLALDGDGDRCVLVDSRGEVVDGDALLLLLARPPGLVGTVMCNSAIEDTLSLLGVRFARAAVGDRNVALEMARLGWPVGGEPSGHVLLSQGLPTGDGLLTGLLALAGGLDLAERLKDWRPHPQAQLAVFVPRKPPLASLPQVALAEAEALSAGAKRVVLRYSGTEPMLRVMVEGPGNPQTLAARLAERILAAIQEV